MTHLYTAPRAKLGSSSPPVPPIDVEFELCGRGTHTAHKSHPLVFAAFFTPRAGVHAPLPSESAFDCVAPVQVADGAHAGHFRLTVPPWVREDTLHTCGLWLFVPCFAEDGTTCVGYERASHGWNGSLTSEWGARTCTISMRATDGSDDAKWLIKRSFALSELQERSLGIVRDYISIAKDFWRSDAIHRLSTCEISTWKKSSTPYPIAYGTHCLPLFSHVLPLASGVPVDPVATPAFFNHFTSVALKRLGMRERDFLDSTGDFYEDPRQAAVLMEVLSEVATLHLRGCAYTCDAQFDKTVDVWEFINNRLPPAFPQRFDCEDGTEFVCRVVKTLHALCGTHDDTPTHAANTMARANPAISDAVARLGDFASLYEPCMLICTLRLQHDTDPSHDTFTYHACPWMADRAWLDLQIAELLHLPHDALDEDLVAPVSAVTRNKDGELVTDLHESTVERRMKEHKSLLHARRRTAFRTSFVIEATSSTQAARLPAGIDRASTDKATLRRDPTLDGKHNADSGDDAADWATKIWNDGLFGTETDHRFYGVAYTLYSPYAARRGCPELMFCRANAANEVGAPMQRIVDYDASVRLRMAAAESEDLSVYVKATQTLLGTQPRFKPLALTGATEDTFVRVDDALMEAYHVRYCSPKEVDTVLEEMQSSREDGARVLSADTGHGTRVAQVLVPRRRRPEPNPSLADSPPQLNKFAKFKFTL